MNYNYNMSKIYMNKLEAKIKDLESRIDKAIKHIEKYGDEIIYLYDMSEVRLKELLEILKGENNDNNSSSN